MFTGIITDVGEVLEVEQRGDLRARIATGYDVDSIDLGASIACDGICLTVTALGSAPTGSEACGWFDVELSAETLSATRFGREGLAKGTRLNLERPLRVGDELGGHIVSGHVDGVSEVASVRADGDSLRVEIRVPGELARFIAPKGSITLNGVSLTVNGVMDCGIGVNLIPHTRKHTTWDSVCEGDLVNVEVDMLARYIARLQSTERRPNEST